MGGLMRDLEIGEMRNRVRWESPGPKVLDGFNQRVPSWTDHGEFWATVEPLTGYELVNAKQLKPELTTKVTLHNLGAIAPTHRLIDLMTGRALNVVFVFRLDPMNRYLACHCIDSPLSPPVSSPP